MVLFRRIFVVPLERVRADTQVRIYEPIKSIIAWIKMNYPV
jgi:hypothetical protein